MILYMMMTCRLRCATVYRRGISMINSLNEMMNINAFDGLRVSALFVYHGSRVRKRYRTG